MWSRAPRWWTRRPGRQRRRGPRDSLRPAASQATTLQFALAARPLVRADQALHFYVRSTSALCSPYTAPMMPYYSPCGNIAQLPLRLRMSWRHRAEQ
jgi:hypothetical protein